MHILKSLVFLVIFLFESIIVFAQSKTELHKYETKELIADLDSMYSYLLQTHPNPFSILSQADFVNKLDSVKKKINHPMTIPEYYGIISPLVATIGDGHTSIKFPGGNKLLTDESELFPYTVTCSIDSPNILVVDYFSFDKQIMPLGSQLLSINGISSTEIINKIIENTSGESKYYRLMRGSNYMFGMLLSLYYNLNGNFDVSYRYKGKIKTVSIKPVTFKKFREFASKPKNSNQNPLTLTSDYSLHVLEEKQTAIIDFKYFNDEEKFPLFLDSAFKTIREKGISNLIIDLRENGGGNSALGDQLFSYISKVPFKQFDKSIIKYSEPQKTFMKQMCEDDSNFCQTYYYLQNKENGSIESISDTIMLFPDTSSNHFYGKVYLLISLKTFSSASSFAQCFKNYNMGTIIGEETGGWIVSYGDKIQTSLPNSGLTFYISQKKFYLAGAKDDDFHGVIPDIKVSSINALDYTMKLISK